MIANLELGFYWGGGAFFVGFPNSIIRLFARLDFAVWRLRLVQKNDEPTRGLEFRRKTKT